MIKNSILSFAILLVICFLGEGIVRLLGVIPAEASWYQMDASLGWVLRPGSIGEQRQEGRAEVRVNSQGFRGPEVEYRRAPNVYRVAVLGDSFVEAFQVSDHDSFTRVAEKKLASCPALLGRKVEILNFGVRGYGTAQEVLLQERVLERFHPEVLVLGFFAGNDLYNNHPLLNPTNPELSPFYLPQSKSFTQPLKKPWTILLSLRNSSALVQLVWRSFSAFEESPARLRQAELQKQLGETYQDWLVYRSESIPEMNESWSLTEELLRIFHRRSAESSVESLLLYVPGAIELHPEKSIQEGFQKAFSLSGLDGPEQRVEQIAREEGLEFFSLAAALRPLVEEEKLYLYGFPNTKLGIGHWNENGHRAVGEVVGQKLCDRLSLRLDLRA